MGARAFAALWFLHSQVPAVCCEQVLLLYAVFVVKEHLREYEYYFKRCVLFNIIGQSYLP